MNGASGASHHMINTAPHLEVRRTKASLPVSLTPSQLSLSLLSDRGRLYGQRCMYHSCHLRRQRSSKNLHATHHLSLPFRLSHRRIRLSGCARTPSLSICLTVSNSSYPKDYQVKRNCHQRVKTSHVFDDEASQLHAQLNSACCSQWAKITTVSRA